MSRPPSVPSLLGLPAELRQRIYDYVFQASLDELGHPPGNGISTACSQLYRETRIQYYNTVCFMFHSIKDCRRFLKRLGPISHHLGSLDIYLDDTISDITRLRDIFNILLPISEIHNLKLRIGSRPSTKAPIYFDSARISNPAMYYDSCLRPSSHPLAKIESIRTLRVDGRSNLTELEEAILKLTLNMKRLAKGKPWECTETTAGAIQHTSQWSHSYSLKIQE